MAAREGWFSFLYTSESSRKVTIGRSMSGIHKDQKTTIPLSSIFFSVASDFSIDTSSVLMWDISKASF